MSFENSAENLPPANEASNEELPKNPDDLPAVPDPENTEQAQEESVEEEIAEMPDAKLLEHLSQIRVYFSAARLYHESLSNVDGKEAEYVLALADARRIQEKMYILKKEIKKRKLEIITPEYIPKPEEVLAVVARLTDKEIIEVRREKDDKGLCLLEVRVNGDNEGEVTEYTYRREGQGGTAWTNEIDSAHYLDYESGIPISGDCVAKYEDGDWNIDL